MARTSDFKELIRLLVRNDFEGHRRLTEVLDAQSGWHGYAEFLGAAFFVAIERRFRPGQDVATIIRFVAEAREQFDETGSDIDPVAAETLIRSVLGDQDASSLDGKTVGAIETVLLHKLLTDEDLTGEQLDAFLSETSHLLKEWEGSSATNTPNP